MDRDAGALITARQLNRATLGRQLLLERAPLTVSGAVGRIVAMQAQEAASPYVALWTRVAGFDPGDLDMAFADRAILKATLMRITLHAVGAADYPAFHAAMQPTLRGARMADPRFTRAGVTANDAHAIVPALRAYVAVPRTNAEVDAWIDEHVGVQSRAGIWWALRQVGPFVHAPTGGPWSFGLRPSYVASPDGEAGDPRAGLQALIRRYLEGFGPASVADMAQFGLVHRSLLREALDGIDGTLERFDGPGGTTLYDVPGAPRPEEGTPAPPRLLPMWDSVLLAYADRSRIIPPDVRGHVIRRNGDVLPTFLVDGQVAGMWRPLDDGIELTALAPVAADAWEALDAEARSLRAFLADRDPLVYRRYAHWWARIPGLEVRVLGTSPGT